MRLHVPPFVAQSQIHAVGTTVEDGVADRDVTLEGLGWLLGEAFRTAPALAGLRFLRAWAGLRPATEDGLPVVGPWPGMPGRGREPLGKSRTSWGVLLFI